MKNEKVTFRILLRSPKYPVIVIAEDDIYSAFGIKELGAICYISEPTDDDSYIRIIDNSGEEFLYMPEQVALVPGIARKKWTKNEIIELFNHSETAKEKNFHYPPKSLSNKRLSAIVTDICKLLGHNNDLQRTSNGAC